ncbi:DUF523 domain-containing protein [Litoribacillus peritrichatus]|uniref:DUF523 domain-containing protein n=1 Tax=Litoribacillus peritrichatus TaxID=718191 RepID=A0ABP7N3V5_9GAMM
MRIKILVSACLLGSKVRYNGTDKKAQNDDFEWLLSNHEIIPLCPEVAAGLPTPRPPAEIQFGTGEDVLTSKANVMGNDGVDVTAEFIRGAHIALEVCLAEGIQYAVLTELSPSCGSSDVYDGRFSGKTVPGAGVVAALLKQHGIRVFNQHNVGHLKALLAPIQNI